MSKRPIKLRTLKGPNRQSGGISRMWREDGTPCTPEEYRRAGLPVPTAKQLLQWAEDDQRRQAERDSR